MNIHLHTTRPGRLVSCQCVLSHGRPLKPSLRIPTPLLSAPETHRKDGVRQEVENGICQTVEVEDDNTKEENLRITGDDVTVKRVKDKEWQPANGEEDTDQHCLGQDQPALRGPGS